MIAGALAVALAAGGYAITSQNMAASSTSSQQASCVRAGEPLYATTQLVPLANFTLEWGTKYVVSVNATAQTVLVEGANGVGASLVKSVTFDLVAC